MVQAGHERTGSLEHPLADLFRSVIAELGGGSAVAEELLTRFRSLEYSRDGKITGDIYREADNENDIGGSWVRLEFNPHRQSLVTTIFLGGLAKRELAKDLLTSVGRVYIRDEEAVVFVNRDGRILWLNRENKVTTSPI